MSYNGEMIFRGSLSAWVVAACAIPVVMCLSSCSREAKPKTPAKPARTAAVPLAVQTGHLEVALSSPTGMVQWVPPRPISSTPERQRAVRAKQKAFARQAIAEEIQKRERDIEGLTDQMQAMRAGAGSNETVRATLQVLAERRTAYDQERSKLPGMLELWKEREAAKARLLTLRAQPEDPGRDKDIAQVQERIDALGGQMIGLEQTERTNASALRQAVETMVSAEAGLEDSLLALPGYRALVLKRQELQEHCRQLRERLAAMGSEDQQ